MPTCTVPDYDAAIGLREALRNALVAYRRSNRRLRFDNQIGVHRDYRRSWAVRSKALAADCAITRRCADTMSRVTDEDRGITVASSLTTAGARMDPCVDTNAVDAARVSAGRSLAS